MSTVEADGRGPRIAILYDCAYPFVPGGGQKRLFEVSRRLVARGWRVDWYAMKSWSEPGEVTVQGIRFIPVAAARPMYRADGKRAISQTLAYGRAIARFPRLRDYDFIHLGQWPYFHFFPAKAFSLLGASGLSADWWETWQHHWLDYYGTRGRLGMLIERVCARVPTRVVAISERGSDQLSGLGVASARIAVIHNGIDWQRIQEAKPDDRASDLIYLGRLQPHKNVDLLLRSLSLLGDRGMPLSLAIVGDGPQRDALEVLAAELNLTSQVRFYGAIGSDDEVYGLLKSSCVFVHPSTKEGGGSITSLEANAAGLPVIAFRHDGGISPELIKQGLNGYWVEEVSASALGETIAQAWTDGASQSRPEACRTFAARFDWDLIADQYERFFQG